MARSKERERELARRRYERRMQRRQQQHRRSRQTGIVAATVVAVLAVIGAVAYLAVASGDDTSSSKLSSGGSASASTAPSGSASAQPSASPSASGSGGAASGSCSYQRAGQASRDVGVPPAKPSRQVIGAQIKLNTGTLLATLDGRKAPCTVNSFSYLAGKGYFNGVRCHRLTTSGIYVLQCGDPTGTGSGGPGYQFPDENLGSLGVPAGQQTTYPAGTLAMANAGPGTNGSQFFIVYKDSPLAASYTPFGRITKGLDVVRKIAATGTDNGQGDGKPKNPVTMEAVTVLK